MKKVSKIMFGLAALAIVVSPAIPVYAQEPTTAGSEIVVQNGVAQVKDEAEFRAAMNNAEVKTIELTTDITIENKLNIIQDKTIIGNNHSIKYVGKFKNDGDKYTWGSAATEGEFKGGVYVIQAYTANVTLRDITLTGANVGLGVNGANVTLEGTVNVTGNGFGGIEVTKGQNVQVLPSLTINGTIVNEDEVAARPTLWTDGITAEEAEDVAIKYQGVELAVSVTKDGNPIPQVQLFLNEENKPTTDVPGITDVADLDAADYRPVTEPETPEEPTTPPDTQDRVEDVENPETSDQGLLYMALSVIGLGGLAVSMKKFMTRKQN